MSDLMISLAGYAASLLLAISLLVNNDVRFRWLNSFGSLSFILYGLLIGALPIILTNTILLAINGYYLIRIYSAHEDFDLIEFRGGEQLVHKFLNFYRKDISHYFPGYVHDSQSGNISFVVLRDLVIANIFVARPGENGKATILLNYTVPRYRDYKVGRFIFERENQFLLSRGVSSLVYEQVLNRNHEKFIRVMGFKTERIDGREMYVKHLQNAPGADGQ
jgi:hypothetical protein